MLAPSLDVRQAPRGDPEDLLGCIVELVRAHAQPAQEAPHRGVVHLEERAQIHCLALGGNGTGRTGALSQVINLGRGCGERQIASEWDRLHSSKMDTRAQQGIGRPRQPRRRGAEYLTSVSTLRRKLSERESPAHLGPYVE